MKIRQQDQSGFTVVEGLLIVLVLAVIGFGGYYVWHTQHKNKSNSSTATTSSKPSKISAAQPLSISGTQQLLNTFYTKYLAAVNNGGDAPKQVVQQYGTTNLINYAYPSSGGYAENPITCSQAGPSKFSVSGVTSSATSAAATVTETFDSDTVKINATVVSQSGSLKVDTITCTPALVPSQDSN